MDEETQLSTSMHPSRLAMGRRLSGDLSPDVQAIFEGHAQACVPCTGKLEDARRVADRFLAAYPDLESLALACARRAPARLPEENPKVWLRAWFRFAPAVALATLALVAGALYWNQPNKSGDLSVKGDARFYLFINGAQSRKDTLACRAKDTLQFGLISQRPVHYAVLYRDDQGGLGVYMDGGEADPVGAPKGQNLPHSLVLTGDWRHETVYCVWSRRPFPLRAAREAAAGAARGGLSLQTYHLMNSLP